jgi:3-phosphoshikimate 1-carboxyvinyltransferase
MPIQRSTDLMSDLVVVTFSHDGHTSPQPVEIGGPGDKSISHRALLLSALADGDSRLTGLSQGEDVVATRRVVQQLGADVRSDGDALVVTGRGAALGQSTDGAELELDFGNAGTGIRLALGVLSGIQGRSFRLVGDASLSRRPMNRVITPLAQLGARIDGVGPTQTPPLNVVGQQLSCVLVDTNVPSAQVKSALLLAGLWAVTAGSGEMQVEESTVTRRHTEEMLRGFGAQLEVVDTPSGGAVATLRSGLPLRAVDVDVPRDPSQIAFWVVGALLAQRDVVSRNVYAGTGRLGLVELLQHLGAPIEVSDVATSSAGPVATVTTLGTTPWHPATDVEVDPAAVSSLVDEVPVLALLLATRPGTHRIRGLAELRIKESDRVASTAQMLAALGRRVDVEGDDLVVHGTGEPFSATQIDSHGDHRIAMCGAIAALYSDGPVTVTGWESVATSYPDFEKDWNLCVS